jgi:hypothetical protein
MNTLTQIDDGLQLTEDSLTLGSTVDFASFDLYGTAYKSGLLYESSSVITPMQMLDVINKIHS